MLSNILGIETEVYALQTTVTRTGGLTSCVLRKGRGSPPKPGGRAAMRVPKAKGRARSPDYFGGRGRAEAKCRGSA